MINETGAQNRFIKYEDEERYTSRSWLLPPQTLAYQEPLLGNIVVKQEMLRREAPDLGQEQ
jgi:hypothetical protein